MQHYLDRLTNTEARKYMKKGAEVFAKAPHLPDSFREFLVVVAPWLTIIGALFAVLATLSNFGALFGGSAIMRMYTYYATAPMLYYLIMAVIQAASAVLLFNAFKPLQDRAFTGWAFLFWNMVLSVISTLLQVLFGYTGSFVGAAIGMIIGFYVLYEMRSLYSGKKKVTAKVDGKKTA